MIRSSAILGIVLTLTACATMPPRVAMHPPTPLMRVVDHPRTPVVIRDPVPYWTMRAECKDAYDLEAGQYPRACNFKGNVFDQTTGQFICRVVYPEDDPDMFDREAKNCYGNVATTL